MYWVSLPLSFLPAPFLRLSRLDSSVCESVGQARTRELAQGWGNKYGTQLQKGYYIGRGHASYTEVKVGACHVEHELGAWLSVCILMPGGAQRRGRRRVHGGMQRRCCWLRGT